MGFFDRDLFDFNGDGKVDGFETYVGLQMMAGSRQEAIALTGDDTFYTGSDSLEEDEDELADELEMAGLDIDELADMDEDERREALEDAVNGRYGLLVSDLWEHTGFHCGECLEVKVDDKWVKSRMEMDIDRNWYLVDTPYTGDLEYVRARI